MLTTRILGVARIVLGASIFAGCAAPMQYQGPIFVDAAGFSQRFRQLCERGLVTGDLEQACVADQPVE